MDNITSVNEPLRELALFAGAGGGILGGMLLGWETVCAVEIEPYAAAVLCARQNDGILPPFPIWDDIRTFDGKPWRGIVDVVSGGFPCQDISAAGKGAGIDGDRSGLWSEMARIIREVRPRFAFVENSPMLTSRGLYRVLGDLAEMGYDARWGVLGHNNIGGQHRRERIWIIADSNKGTIFSMVKRKSKIITKWDQTFGRESWISFLVEDGAGTPPSWRTGEKGFDTRPIMWRKTDGMADAMDRIAAIGNGQVPAVAALAWDTLSQA